MGNPRPRLATPPATASTGSDAVRVLRTAQRSGLLPAPIPWQVYVHARLAERIGADRAWRRAGVVVGRGNGKTDGVLAPYILDSIETGVGVLGLAQNLDVAMDTFTKVADTVEGDPYLSRRIKRLYRGKGAARIDLWDAARRRVATYRVSVTAKKCRGPRAPRLAVDEAAYVSNDVISAARYVQNGSGMPGQQQVLAVCTAGDDTEDAAGELQWFSRWRNMHLESLDPRLLWLEWSIPEDADPRDPAWWPYAVPALGHFITDLEIADNLDDPSFVQEALSRWGVTARRAITADLWNAGRVSDDQAGDLRRRPPAIAGLAVAVAPERGSASLVASYRVGDRVLVKVLDARPGTAWAVPVVKEWQQRARVPVDVDRHGPAGALAGDLAAAGVPLESATLDTFAAACEAFDDLVAERRLMHYGQPVLDDAVASARWRGVGERRVWARRAGDIAALEAASLAAARARHAARRPRVV